MVRVFIGHVELGLYCGLARTHTLRMHALSAITGIYIPYFADSLIL